MVNLGRYVIGAGLAIAVLAGCSKYAATTTAAVAHSPTATAFPKASWSTPQPCVGAGFDPSRVKVAAPTPAIVAEVARTYQSKPVLQLRLALNAFVAGTANAETTRSLSPYGTSLAKDRFMVLWITKYLFGGWTMRIQFRRHMNSMYETWLYIAAGSLPTLRYMQLVPCTRKQIHALNRLYSAIYAIPYDG